MRKSLLVVLFVLCGVSAFAQETYSVGPVSASNVSQLGIVVTFSNGETCARYGLPRTCTQAQACTAANAAGGSSCTAAQARAANARIYPATFAGREEYTTFAIAQNRFNELVATVIQSQHIDYCAAWNAFSNANKDTHCTALGLPTGWVAGTGLGCNPC